MIGLAGPLLWRFKGVLLTGALVVGALIYIQTLRVTAENRRIAIEKLGARAAELHAAYEREREARHIAQRALVRYQADTSAGAARQAASRRRVAGSQGMRTWGPARMPGAIYDELRIDRSGPSAERADPPASDPDGAVPGGAPD